MAKTSDSLTWNNIREIKASNKACFAAQKVHHDAQEAAKAARLAFELEIARLLFGSSDVKRDGNAYVCDKGQKGAPVMDSNEVVFSHRFGPAYALAPRGSTTRKSGASSNGVVL